MWKVERRCSMDPRVKLCFILSATTLAILIRDARWMMGFAVLVLAVCLFLGLEPAFLKRRMKHFIPVMLAAMLSQFLFVRTGTPVVTVGDTVLIRGDAIERAFNLVGRLLIIFACAGVMINENRQRVITALAKMRIPYVFNFMLMIALRFIPVFSQSFSNAMISMQLRGINLARVPFGKKVGLYSSLLLPVVSDAILKSQDLAIAMEARGFRAYKQRTYARELHLQTKDIVWLLGIGTGLILFIYLYWKGRAS